MRKKLHPAVLTVGMLQVVFGVLGMCCGGFGVLNTIGLYAPQFEAPPPAQVSQPANKQGKPTDFNSGFNAGYQAGMAGNIEVIQKGKAYREVKMADAVVGLFLSLLMITSGIGLFFMQSWARWLAIGYAGLSVLDSCCAVGYHLFAVLPILNALSERFTRQGDPAAASGLWGLKFFPILGAIFIAYPILVLILLLIPPVSKAFRGIADDADVNDLDAGWRERDRDRGRDRDRDDDRFRS